MGAVQRIVLASTSPRRRDLLAARGIAFELADPGVDESTPGMTDAIAIARALAERKCRAVLARVPAGQVIGADTVVAAADGAVLGKPDDHAHAHRMLSSLSGTTHRVITGFAVGGMPGGRVIVGHVATSVTMRPMSAAEIAAYVASGESDGKAGSYAIQETGDQFVTRIEGPFDNVVGLPVDAVLAALAELADARPVSARPVVGGAS